jgi:hypothetical protein
MPPDTGQLVYVGDVGTGFTEAARGGGTPAVLPARWALAQEHAPGEGRQSSWRWAIFLVMAPLL